MIVIMIILTAAASAVQLQNTQISTTRNAYRDTLCNYFQKTYTTSQISSSKSTINTYNYLSSSQVQNILYNRDLTNVSTITIIFVIPHIICLVILITMWPYLCCCCAKPQKYPLCEKCRKPQKQLYSRWQLKWTSYLLLLFCMVIVAGSIIAIFGAADITKSYSHIGCRALAALDDTVNGRLSPTVESRFFVGLTNLATQLNTFSSQLSTFYTQSNSSLNSSSQVRINQVAVLSQLITQYATYNNIAYSNAFSSNGTSYVTINSEFKAMYYGPLTNQSTILGNINNTLSTIFTQINAALDPMVSSWGRLSSATQSGVSSSIASMTNTTTSKVSDLNNLLNNIIGPFFNKIQLYNNINIGFRLIYGLVLALSLLMTISSVILTFCTVVKIRLIVYFACGALTLLGVICASVLVIMSMLLPNAAHICSYMDSKLSTGSATQSLISNLGYSQLSDLLTNCMSDGNGKIIPQLNTNFSTTFDDITTISTNVVSFNTLIPLYSTAALTQPFTDGLAIINKITKAQLLQINDSVALTHINNVAYKLYNIPPACTSIRVSSDSWLPSFALYACPASFSINPQCKPLSDFTLCPQGCYQIMEQFTSASGDNTYASTLYTRYGASCIYADYIIKLHDNWNVPRRTQMNNIITDINAIQTLVTNYDNKLKTIQASVNSFKTIIDSNFNSRLNQTSGSFYGVDCRVIGQSILELRDSFCVGMINSLSYNVIALALISYGILFGSCCAVCAGVRHFKHLQRMQVHVGYSGVQLSISQNRIFDK